MTLPRHGVAAMLFAAAMISHVEAATRVYEAGGAGCPLFTAGLYQIAAALQARGAAASVGCNFDVAEIASHRGDRIVLVGHSYGALHAADAARALEARGVAARVIAIDPLMTPNVGASCAGVAGCVCFWGEGLPMPRARNVFIRSNYGHIRFTSDPRVQAAVVAAALGR